MHLSKETRTAYAAMACCVLGIVLSANVTLFPLLQGFRYIPKFVFFSGTMLVWMRLMRYRFLHRRVLLCFTAIGVLAVMWILAQTIKYEFASCLPTGGRLIWYSYYVPISLVPPLLLVASLHVGLRDGLAITSSSATVILVGVAFAFLFITNDLHHLVFRFPVDLGPRGNYSQGANHTFGPLYYAVWMWAASVSAASLSILFWRSVSLGLVRRLVGPVLVMVLMALILPLYRVDFWWLDQVLKFSEISCLFVIAFIESLFIAGLFPSNSGYGALWRASSLRGGFVDGQGCLTDVSTGAPCVTTGQVNEALAHPLVLEGGQEELVAHRVHGGTAFWVRDLSTIHALRERLEDLGDSLSQERLMLEAENSLAREREIVLQREALYAQVVANTSSQLDDLKKALDAMPDDDEAFLAEMRRVAVLATYIKRSANLTLLGEDGAIDVRELALALQESATGLRSLGITVNVRIEAQGAVVPEAALGAYAAFERRIEEALPALRSLTVTLAQAVRSNAVELRSAMDIGEARTLTYAMPLAFAAETLEVGDVS